jgi:hypothetical protein
MLISKRSALSIALWAQNLWAGNIHDPMTPEHQPNTYMWYRFIRLVSAGTGGAQYLALGLAGHLGMVPTVVQHPPIAA